MFFNMIFGEGVYKERFFLVFDGLRNISRNV